MEIAKVVGNIVSNSKVKELETGTLFLVRVLDKNLKNTKNVIAAVDTIGVGYGDNVLITTGSGARKTEISKNMFTDASIVARIDHLDN